MALRAGLGQLFLHHAYRWLRGSLRVLHQLWLEVTGTIFLGLALFALPSVLREWRLYRAGGSWSNLALAAGFIVMMVGFGVYSFIKARRMR